MFAPRASKLHKRDTMIVARRLAPVLAILTTVTTSLTSGCSADSQMAMPQDSDSASSGGTGSTISTSEATSGQDTSATTQDNAASTNSDPLPGSSGPDMPDMPCEGACLPPAPEGWSGPAARIALGKGSVEDSACGGSFPESVATGFSALDAPASECSCSCGAPTGGACDPEIDVDIFDSQCNATTSGGACLQPGVNFTACSSVDETLSVGSETFADSDRFGIRVRADAPAVASAPTCAPSDDSVLDPPVTRGDFELCAAAVDDGAAGVCAGGEVCTAKLLNPFESAACIWAEGERDCPESDYTQRTLLHETVVDTRECSSCSCGAAANASCAGEVEVIAVYASGGFVFDPPETFEANGDCSPRITPNSTPAAGVSFMVDYDAQVPTSSACQPSGGNLTGDVAPAGTRTVCCQ